VNERGRKPAARGNKEPAHRRVELGLAASRDEDVRTLKGEPPRGGKPDPAVASSDDRYLPI
jgi:hypothetical protein